MLKIKFKVMLSVFLYFISNFIIVFSNDIKSNYTIRKQNSQEQKGLCDLSTHPVSFNFNELYKKEGYNVTSGDKIFYLNICGHAPECGGNVAVCYKNKYNTQKIESIGRLSDISFGSDEIRFKISKKKKLRITLICDRHINEPNITYDKISSFHFEFRTPKACFPKPTNCLFKSKDERFTYDLSSLKLNNNNWDVHNVPNDYKIYLNMCGNLNSISNLKTNSDCFYKGTQICLVYNNGSSKNLGVFSDPMLLKDDILRLSINGGSLCDNVSNTITTNIEMICSLNESGPIFVSNTNCEYNIKWMTPKACPHIIDETSNCILRTPIFNVGKMSFQTNIIQLNTTHYIKYNTCDRFNCNKNEEALFCLINHNNNEETVIGNYKDNNKLISYDGLLRTTYYGDKCASHNNNNNNGTENRVNIEFNCDYTKNKEADIKMSEDGCTTNITIHTNEVCRDHEPKVQDEQCSTFSNQSGIMNYYNLSALTLTDRNYEIRDTSNPNIVYILNVCQPILYRPGTYCEPTAIICMRNDSIANIYEKSKTLGHYSSSTVRVAQNQSLLIQFEGGLCHFSMNHYFTSIEFICDPEAKNTLPTLIRNTDCEYNFRWVTRYACPFTNNTTFNVGTRINETKDNRIYKEISENVEKSPKNINIEVTTSNSRKDITHHDDLDLVKIMSTESPTSTTTIRPKPRATSLIVPIDIKVSNTSGLFVKNCTIEDFNMNHLPRNINISSKTGRIYSLDICNLRKSQDCKLDNCLSNLKKDASNNLIEMDFYGKTKCLHGNGYFKSVIYLKCTEESPQLSVLKEDICSVELEWKHSAACALLQEKPKPIVSLNNEVESPKSGHMATILSSVFALLLILCVSVFTSIYFWRKRQVHNSPSCLSRCDYNKIKDSSKIV